MYTIKLQVTIHIRTLLTLRYIFRLPTTGVKAFW
jgi:hypothetical protein